MYKYIKNSAYSNFIKINLRILIVSVLVSCQQYDDDTFLSFTSPKQRLSAKWELVEVLRDGEDYSDTYKMMYLVESIDYKYNETYEVFWKDSILSYGIWSLSDDKTKLFTEPINGINEEYDISRLQYYKLWLRKYDVDLTDSLLFKFKKIK